MVDLQVDFLLSIFSNFVYSHTFQMEMYFVCSQNFARQFIIHFHGSKKFLSKSLSLWQVSRKPFLSMINFIQIAIQDVSKSFMHHARRFVQCSEIPYSLYGCKPQLNFSSTAMAISPSNQFFFFLYEIFYEMNLSFRISESFFFSITTVI